MRIATWNIHGGVGLDRRFDADRIARVIGELDADVVALQEFWTHPSFDLRRQLETTLGMHAVAAPTFAKRGRDFGNVVLSRDTPAAVMVRSLAVDRREPRNAIDLQVGHDGISLRIVATHLGLRGVERRIQVERLIAALDEHPAQPTVLLGDFNEWRSAGALQAIDRRFGVSRAPKTFPAPWPLVALDRIWIHPAALGVDLRVHASRAARIASDHLPLVATLVLR